MNYEEILERWDEVGAYCVWYAVDSFEPGLLKGRREFVGTRDAAKSKFMDHYKKLSEISVQPFRRVGMISNGEAREFFENGGEYEVEFGGVTSIKGAMRMMAEAHLPDSKQHVHNLVDAGRIKGWKAGTDKNGNGGVWVVSVDSVQEYIKNNTI